MGKGEQKVATMSSTTLGQKCSDSCTIQTRFKVGQELVNVISRDQDYTFFKTDSGKIVHCVPVGSPQHQQLLSKCILELEHKLIDSPSEVLSKELEQRRTEMQFMLEYCPVDDTRSDGLSTDDAFGLENQSEDPSVSDEKVMHVTAGTFGDIKKYKEIELPEANSLFPRPIVRQYFRDGVLHRQNQKMHVMWIELFTDLIYVGAFAKTGHLIQKGYDWPSFLKFFLLFVPFLYRWRGQTMFHNTIHHESPIQKVLITY
jgi:hypothetical protein